MNLRAWLCVVAVTCFFGVKSAHAVLIDISNIGVDGGAPVTLTVAEDENIGPGFNIGFNFTVEHFGSSWPTETLFTLTNSFWGVDYTLSGSDCGFVNGSGQGVQSCITTLLINEDSMVSFGDSWHIALSDTFNDGSNPDYIFGQGSFIGWGDDFDSVVSAQVPEPGTLALMGLGLLGMTRLRRKA